MAAFRWGLGRFGGEGDGGRVYEEDEEDVEGAFVVVVDDGGCRSCGV